jgi:hypothetical protein
MPAFRPVAVLVLLPALFAAGCSGRIGGDVAQQCSQGLDVAYAELEKAKADGFGQAVQVTKAASLIAAAGVQKQFEKYPNCVDKVQRARAYLADVRR